MERVWPVVAPEFRVAQQAALELAEDLRALGLSVVVYDEFRDLMPVGRTMYRFEVHFFDRA